MAEVAEAFQGRHSPDAPDLWIRDDGTGAGFGATLSGRRLFAAFFPDETDEGRWRLMTCYPVQGILQAMTDWLDVDAPPLSETAIREKFRQEGWEKVEVGDRKRGRWHHTTVEPGVTQTSVSVAHVAFARFEHGRSVSHIGLVVR